MAHSIVLDWEVPLIQPLYKLGPLAAFYQPLKELIETSGVILSKLCVLGLKPDSLYQVDYFPRAWYYPYERILEVCLSIQTLRNALEPVKIVTLSVPAHQVSPYDIAISDDFLHLVLLCKLFNHLGQRLLSFL